MNFYVVNMRDAQFNDFAESAILNNEKHNMLVLSRQYYSNSTIAVEGAGFSYAQTKEKPTNRGTPNVKK